MDPFCNWFPTGANVLIILFYWLNYILYVLCVFISRIFYVYKVWGSLLSPFCFTPCQKLCHVWEMYRSKMAAPLTHCGSGNLKPQTVKNIIFRFNIAYVLLLNFTNTWLNGSTIINDLSGCSQLGCNLVQTKKWEMIIYALNYSIYGIVLSRLCDIEVSDLKIMCHIDSSEYT